MPDLVPRGGALPPDEFPRGAPTTPDREPGYPSGVASDDDSIELRELLAVLRRNVRLVLGITILFAGMAGYLAFTQPPEYRARAVLRLQNERQTLAGGLAGSGMEEMLGRTADPLLSEVQVLRSRRVLGEVVERLGLRLRRASAVGLADVYVAADAPVDTILLRFHGTTIDVRHQSQHTTARYGETIYAGGVRFTVPADPGVSEETLVVIPAAAAVDRLVDRVSARAVDRTNVVEVDVRETHPHLAQQVVNTLVEVFREVSVQNTIAESTRRRVFIEQQLARTDSALAEAQLDLSSFREREEVFSSREQFAAQQSGMMELDVRREELIADARMYRSLMVQIRDDPDGRGLRTLVSSPGVAQNPVISQLYTQLQQHRAARDSALAAGRSPDNPDVRRHISLLASTQLQLHDALNSHIMSVEARIGALDTLRVRSAAGIRSLPQKEAEEVRLVQRVETARRVADQLREEYQRAQIAEAVEVGKVQIVDFAEVPKQPIGSGRGLKLALGLMLGLMMGSGAAFMREHLNTSITSSDELQTHLGLAGLAVVPRLLSPGSAEPSGGRLRLPAFLQGNTNGNGVVQRPMQELVTIMDGRSGGAESFRNLRTNLMFAQGGDGLKRIVITSAMAAEGKSTTSANLAVTYAHQGLRVLLVDGDLRKARLHRVFGVTREPGFTELVLGMNQPDESIRETSVENLSVLPSGTLPPTPSELLGSARARQALDALQADYDVIIIDAPPVLVGGDASILGVLSDGVILVLRAGSTDRHAAQASVRQLQNVGARIIGAVLNDPDSKMDRTESSYYYAYRYYGDD